MRKPFKKSLNQIPLEQAHGGTGGRQIMLSKNDAVSKYFEAMTKGYLKSGGKFDWHSHQNIDEFFLVTKGRGVVEFKNRDSLEYKEEDLIYIPANIEHRIIASDKVDNEFFFIRLQDK